MPANLIEASRTLVSLAAQKQQVTSKRILDVLIVFGINDEQRELYQSLHERSMRELAPAPENIYTFDALHLTHLHTFDTLYLTDCYLQNIVGQ